jgi:OmcA/MtrC family decaheme c-type cytochrome
LIVIAPNVQVVATGYTGRRAIVEDARCNACHQELGTFTEDAFHAGQRNDGTTCSWCHNVNQNNSGWSGDSTAFVHRIHASAKRQNKDTWHATLKPGAPAGSTNVNDYEGFWDVTYPGILNDCTTCHLPGTFDLSATASQSASGQVDGVDKRPYRTVATGTIAATGLVSPFVVRGTNYGTNFSFSAATGVTTPAAPTTLVTSPTVSVCSACHDSADAISHFKINGAAFYVDRTTGITGTNETCLVCHGTGRIADIAVMHSKNR